MPQSIIKYYRNQNYEAIKRNCCRNDELFVDDTFEANEASIFRNGRCKSELSTILWKRPFQFVKEPVFVLNDFAESLLDLTQGCLGDCWFISAVTSICTRTELADKIIPSGQTFDTSVDSYAGVFRFRIWHQCEWVEVVVDDRLPVNENDELIYCRNLAHPNVLAGPLLEKAYAKLNKCYELLNGGNLVDALIDLTGGGLHETFRLDEFNSTNAREVLWERIFVCFSMGSLGGAVIKSTSRSKKSDYLSSSHSYCILKPFEIHGEDDRYTKLRGNDDMRSSKSRNESIKLLKMRNPWGEDSWAGKWSRFSFEWTRLSGELQESLLNSSTKPNGQFFISFDDFVDYFDELYLVHTNLNAFDYSPTTATAVSHDWSCETFLGSWSRESGTAGGCGNEDAVAYWQNPKYLLNFADSDSSSQNVIIIIVSLTQIDQLQKRLESEDGTYESSLEPIAFSLFALDRSAAARCLIDLNHSACTRTHSSGIYLYKREINKKLELGGNAATTAYLLVPSVFDKHVSSRYVLRIFYANTQSRVKIIDLNRRRRQASHICSLL